MKNTRDRDIQKLCDILNYNDTIEDGDIEVVENVLGNEKVDINGRGDEGDTPLISAVHGGHLAIVRRLLEYPGIQIDKEASYGFTALHMACGINEVSIVQLLCQDSRCSPGVVNKKNRHGDTALMVSSGDL